MIERLSGKCLIKKPNGVVLDVNGVGYGVEVPLSCLCELPEAGCEVALWIHTYVREDALRLFGFSKFEDKMAFELLLSVSGVGPKVAMAILSTLTVNALRQAVLHNAPSVLEVVPGVGQRSAEKILMELKPKIKKLHELGGSQLDEKTTVRRGAMVFDEFSLFSDGKLEANDSKIEDVKSALENLGFKGKEIGGLLEKLKKDAESSDFSALLKRALTMLTANHPGLGAS